MGCGIDGTAAPGALFFWRASEIELNILSKPSLLPMQPPESFSTAMQRFSGSMAPRWNGITQLLAADRPPDWIGLKFEARIQRGRSQEFTIHAQFGDRASNRKRTAPQAVLDHLAKLYVAYRDFSPIAEWKSVVMEQTWIAASKSWTYETKWEFLIGSGSP